MTEQENGLDQQTEQNAPNSDNANHGAEPDRAEKTTTGTADNQGSDVVDPVEEGDHAMPTMTAQNPSPDEGVSTSPGSSDSEGGEQAAGSDESSQMNADLATPTESVAASDETNRNAEGDVTAVGSDAGVPSSEASPSDESNAEASNTEATSADEQSPEAPTAEASAPESSSADAPSAEATGAEASSPDASGTDTSPVSGTPEPFHPHVIESSGDSTEGASAPSEPVTSATEATSTNESVPTDAAAATPTADGDAAAATEPVEPEVPAGPSLEELRPIWEELTAKKDSREPIEVEIKGLNRGGAVTEYNGVEIFIPQSHLTIDRGGSNSNLSVGQTIPVTVLEITQFDTDARRVTASRRSLLRSEFLQNLSQGDRMIGTVSSVTDFGAFVDIGGVDGLLHVSEMSHARNKQPRELVKKGDKLEVVVKNIEKGGKRISLGHRELLDSPWKTIGEKYPADSRHKGRVVSITDIGAFVELEPGVDGLIRPRELSWTKRIGSVGDVLKVGEEIDVMILNVNEEQQRIGLSVKRADENPWPGIVEKFADESKEWEGEVKELSNMGAVISVDEIEGFLPRGRMGREANRLTEMKSGDKISVRIIEVDPKRPSVIFGIPNVDGGGGDRGGERYGGGYGGGDRSGGERGGGERGGGGGDRGGRGGGDRNRDRGDRGGGRRGGSRDAQASPAIPSNEIKSAETVSNFSLGDLLNEKMKEKLGFEEKQAPEPPKKAPAVKAADSAESLGSTGGNQSTATKDEGVAPSVPTASNEIGSGESSGSDGPSVQSVKDSSAHSEGVTAETRNETSNDDNAPNRGDGTGESISSSSSGETSDESSGDQQSS